MSLITAYFKKEATSLLQPNSTPSDDKCPDSAGCSVHVPLDEDSNLKSPSPPKRMKIALFTSYESSSNVSCHDCKSKQVELTEQCNVTMDENETPVLADMTADEIAGGNRVCHQTATQPAKQQSRQTALKFENGRCILVPIEPSIGMETGSQDSSQVESTAEDDYQPKKQKRKQRKKGKQKVSNEEFFSDIVDEEGPFIAKRSCRKAALKAAEQLSGLLQEPVGSQGYEKCGVVENCVLPKILVQDSDTLTESQNVLVHTGSDVIISVAKVELSADPVVIAKDVTIVDSSDSDVICLTPCSSSQEPIQITQQPSTPPKKKWSEIFGTKSPHRKSSPNRRSLSPCKHSPRKRSPKKQAVVMSSLATSPEQYTLGIPLLHHVMQQSDSVLWNLPKIEPSAINACLTDLMQRMISTRTSHDLCKDHMSKGLMHMETDFHMEPLRLKCVNSDKKAELLERLTDSSSLCCYYTLLNQQLCDERRRLASEWALWEAQVRLIRAENERLENEVVDIPEDPALELIISIRFLRTDISSESVMVDASWYNTQQHNNAHTTYNLRRRQQRHNQKERFINSWSASSGDDNCKKRPKQLRKRRLKKRKKRLSCFASDDEDSSWSDGECEKKESAALPTSQLPKKPQVVRKPLPGPPNFKPLNDMWVDLYAPKQPDDILGNQAAIQMMCQWLTDWKDGSHGCKLQKRKEEPDCIMLDDDGGSDEEEKTSIVLLVRGPVGCGKTSAIYACASKLGYKVFELNSSSRRSGSQVISILQEATQSHQISTQRRVAKPTVLSQDEESDEVARNDVQSSKPSQTITSFFKPLTKGGKVQTSSCKAAVGDEDVVQVTLASHTVILIEEVDILFEDDKGFWSALYDIINTSRRPIICTCNDPCLVLECQHGIINMCRPSLQEVSSRVQLIALSHDLCVPATVACTLSALQGCDTRRVIHTLQCALCHASTSQHQHSDCTGVAESHTYSVPLLGQHIEEAKCSLFSYLFLERLVCHLESTIGEDCNKMRSLNRPWRNHSRGSNGQSEHSYFQLDTTSSACDWLSDCDIIGSGRQLSSLDPTNIKPWWCVTEQSYLLETTRQFPGQLELDKLEKQKDEISLCVEQLIGKNFVSDVQSDLDENFVLAAAKLCRKRDEFNVDMFGVVQNEFTSHCQLLRSAMATDYLPIMHLMCKSEETRKARQRRFRHYLSSRGVRDTTVSSLLHHQKLVT